MSMYPIASTALSSAGTITFSNIPTTFTHLQVRFSGYVNYTSATSQPMALGIYDINSSLLSPEYYHSLTGDGASATSYGGATSYVPLIGYGTSGTNLNYTVGIIDILDYANTNKNKTIRSIWGYDLNGSGKVGMNSMGIFSTTAIGVITLNFGGFSMGTGSRADLYGISTSGVTGA